MRHLRLTLLSVCLSAVLVGCEQQSLEGHLEDAQEYISTNEISSAVIELKAALQLSPESAEARYMLGEIYLNSGAYLLAEKELLHAKDAAYQLDKTIALLAKTYRLQGKEAELRALGSTAFDLSPETQANFLFNRALIDFYANQDNSAARMVKQSQEIAPNSIATQLGNAYSLYFQGDYTAAVAAGKNILTTSPDNDDAIFLLAQSHSRLGNYPEAINYFAKYKTIHSNSLMADIHLAQAYLNNKQFNQAEKHADAVLARYSNSPLANKIKALCRLNEKDYTVAKQHIDKTLQYGAKNIESLVIAGTTEYYLKNYEQAYIHLSQVIDRLPPDHIALRFLASTQLKLGYVDDYFSTTNRLEYSEQFDPQFYLASSQALLRRGYAEQAADLLDTAEANIKPTAENLNRIGLMQFSMNDDAAQKNLENSLNLNPLQPATRVALVDYHIKKNNINEAIRLAEEWLKLEPDAIPPYNLAASVYQRAGNLAKTTDLYNQSLALDPDNVRAIYFFADQQLEQGNVAEALSMLDKAISLDDRNPTGLFKYFLLSKKTGNPEAGLDRLAAACAKHSTLPAVCLTYANALLMEEQRDKAIQTLEGLTNQPGLGDAYWLLLSKAYSTAENAHKIEPLLNQWTQTDSSNKQAWLQLISYYELQDRFDLALEKTQAALKEIKDSQLSLLEVFFTLLSGDLDTAQATYSSLDTDYQNSPLGLSIYGHLEFAKGNMQAALEPLQQYYQQAPSPKSAAMVFNTLLALDRTDDAVEMLSNHLKAYPSDLKSKLLLAEQAMETDLPLAVTLYQQVVDSQPENLVALNNLAWSLLQTSQPAAALNFAKKAFELAPNQPVITETYANALVATGQKAEADSVLQQALEAHPDNPLLFEALKKY